MTLIRKAAKLPRAVTAKSTASSRHNAARAHMSRIRRKEPRRIGNMRPKRKR